MICPKCGQEYEGDKCPRCNGPEVIVNNADYLKQMQQLFRLDVHLVTEPELPDYADVRVMPWGWNPAIRKRMLKGGVLERNLPTPDALDKSRMPSSA